MTAGFRPRGLALVGCALALAGCGSSSASGTSTAAPASAAASAPAATTAPGSTTTPTPATTAAPPVDASPLAHGPTGGIGEPVRGITCENREFAVTHTHTSLAIFLGGQRVAIPASIGIVDDTCLYWLHTHSDRGVIHVESPLADRRFTLGDFFAVWGYPLGARRLLGATRKVHAWVDRKRWRGDPARIPLRDLASIVLSDRPLATLPAPDFSELG